MEQYTEKQAISIQQAIVLSTFNLVDFDFNSYDKSKIVMYFKNQIYPISFLKEHWIYLNNANSGQNLQELVVYFNIASKEEATKKIKSINGEVAKLDILPALKGRDSSCELRMPAHENV